MTDFKEAREWMVEWQIVRHWPIRVLAAMHGVRNSSPPIFGNSRTDTPLPIGNEQTISQPAMVASMIDAAELSPGDRVLDVGTGSGYAAVAMIGLLIERRGLVDTAREILARLDIANVTVHLGDACSASQGTPCDAIIAAATGPRSRPP